MAIRKYQIKGSSIVEVVMAIAIIGAVLGVSSVVFVNVNQSANTLQDINEEGHVFTDFINHKLILEDKLWVPKETKRTFLEQQEVNKGGAIWLESRLIDVEKRTLWKFEVPVTNGKDEK